MSKEFKKLIKATARTSYRMGRKVYLKPSRVPVEVLERSPWLKWYIIQKDEMNNRDFDEIVKEFAHYNCCEELGLVVNYYIERSRPRINDNPKRIIKRVYCKTNNEVPYKCSEGDCVVPCQRLMFCWMDDNGATAAK